MKKMVAGGWWLVAGGRWWLVAGAWLLNLQFVFDNPMSQEELGT
jgi:hypothetical protein